MILLGKSKVPNTRNIHRYSLFYAHIFVEVECILAFRKRCKHLLVTYENLQDFLCYHVGTVTDSVR